jgi:hypothetical protein
MRAKLIFDLENFEDKISHDRCLKSLDMALALFEMDNDLQNKFITNAMTDIEAEPYMIIHAHLMKLLKKYDLQPENLLT